MEHPGILLKTRFFQPLGLSNYRVAKEIHVPQTRLSQITQGKRRITTDTAVRLGRFFGVPARWFLELQMKYDLHVAGQMVIAEPIGRHIDPDCLVMPNGVRRFRGEPPASQPMTHQVDAEARSRISDGAALLPAGRETVARSVDYGNGFRALVRETA